MAHSNQLREFLLTAHGVELRDVYVGAEGVLTGSARLVQEAREKAAATVRAKDIARRQRELQRKRTALEAQVTSLRAGFDAEEEEMQLLIGESQERETTLRRDEVAMGRSRRVDRPAAGPPLAIPDRQARGDNGRHQGARA